MSTDNFFNQLDNPSKAQPINQNQKTERWYFGFLTKTKRFWLVTVGIFILVLGLLGLVIMAKAGIVYFPGVSELIYHQPQPTRLIVDSVQDQLSSSQPFTVSFDEQAGVISLNITEENLTGYLRRNLAQSANAAFGSQSQIIFSDGRFEFFGPMLRPVKTTLTLEARLFTSNGLLDYQITRLRFGDLDLPPALSDWLIKAYFSNRAKADNPFASLLANFKNLSADTGKPNIRLERFSLTDGQLNLAIYLNLEEIKAAMEKIGPLIDQRLDEQLNRNN
ncbi:MAG: hypothetical protein RB292_02235 [Patescibacteria group bacterium]|jgi:hypothetical protein|nr:hypothetical protein [Patescibacteria group bacterium]